MAKTFTITLPDRIRFSTRAGGDLATLETAGLTDALVSIIAERGFRIIGMNTYNGGGKEASDAEKQAALEKKLAAWKRGEADVTDRGEAIFTVWKEEVFIPHCLENGMTLKAANDLVKAKVTEHLGKGSKATFSNYIEATAIESADQFDGDRSAAREAVEGWYDDQLATRRKAREKASAKVTAPKLDLSAFKKAK